MSFNVQPFTSSLYDSTYYDSTYMDNLENISREQAKANYIAMVTNPDGLTLFKLSVVRTLCDVHNVEWHRSDLDKFLKPFQTVLIRDIGEETLKTISVAIWQFIAQ